MASRPSSRRRHVRVTRSKSDSCLDCQKDRADNAVLPRLSRAEMSLRSEQLFSDAIRRSFSRRHTSSSSSHSHDAPYLVTYRGMRLSDLLCLCCCGLCCLRRSARTLAFWPPYPPTYYYQCLDADCWKLRLFPTAFCPYSVAELETVFSMEAFKVKSSAGSWIACVRLTCSNRPRYTILRSHMNGVDIGQEIGFAVKLGVRCRCNVVLYDYSGYGESTGVPSEENMCADVASVLTELGPRYGLEARNVVLYGQSIGSVPTIDLATKVYVAGVILCSPLFSALRIVFPWVKGTSAFDSFANVRKVPMIACPVLIIHGTGDRLIRIKDAVAIYRKCPNAVEPLWLAGAGHINLELFRSFYERVQRFVGYELPLRDLRMPQPSGSSRAVPVQNRITIQL